MEETLEKIVDYMKNKGKIRLLKEMQGKTKEEDKKDE